MYIVDECPKCGGTLVLLATTRPEKYRCEDCGGRFTEKEIRG